MFGIVSNVLNIVVLTHRRMASSPTNFILTALAISDMFPMLSYLPYAVYFHCIGGVQPHRRPTQKWNATRFGFPDSQSRSGTAEAGVVRCSIHIGTWLDEVPHPYWAWSVSREQL